MNQKKTWTDDEDKIIRNAVKQMGGRPRWKSIAQSVNQLINNVEQKNKRTSKQCRQRWHNKLDPQILDKQWDQDQINLLFNLHNKYGNKWSLIATMMNGRTDNCVKNKFYSSLRKGMRKINKYIVNLKRKLLKNKNICIKQFKDVVLTKLIAVADKKYNETLNIKEKSTYKIEKLSQAIKIALVKVSKNQDDYIGHVKNGVADDTYDVEETLFENIQEFCKNCKRKKGKKKNQDDADLNLEVSEMSEESQEIQQTKSHKKIEFQPTFKLSTTLCVNQTNKNISNKIIFEESNVGLQRRQNKKQDMSQGLKSLNNELFELKTLTNFTKINTEQVNQEIMEKSNQKLEKIQKKQSQGFKAFFNGMVYEQPGFSFFQNIRSVQFERTDQSAKITKDLRPLQIFRQMEVINQLENFQNQLNLLSSSQFSTVEKSQSVFSLYWNIEGIQDANQAIHNSSSLSSNSNKQQQKIMQFFLSKSERKDDIHASQVITRSLKFADSLQLDDLFRRISENKN